MLRRVIGCVFDLIAAFIIYWMVVGAAGEVFALDRFREFGHKVRDLAVAGSGDEQVEQNLAVIAVVEEQLAASGQRALNEAEERDPPEHDP